MTGMGHRTNAGEHEAFCRWCRRYLLLGRDYRKSAKKMVHKSERQQGKRDARSAD